MEKSKEKIQLMFDDIAPTYDRLNHFFTFNTDVLWRREIIKYLNNKNFEATKVLDIASGTGDLTKELLRLDLKKIFAVDISKNMLRIQKEKLNDPRLTLIQADVMILPFESNYFDLVTVGFGMRNFENLEDSMKEIYRVIKPGGKFITLEMFKSKGIATKIFNIYFGKIMPFIGNKISKSKYAYSYLFESVNDFYTVNAFIQICVDNGFRLELSKNNFLKVVNTVYLTK